MLQFSQLGHGRQKNVLRRKLLNSKKRKEAKLKIEKKWLQHILGKKKFIGKLNNVRI